jgi:hypothetical protein
MKIDRISNYDNETAELAELIVDGLTAIFDEIDPNRTTPAKAKIELGDNYEEEIIATTPSGRRFELRLMEIL